MKRLLPALAAAACAALLAGCQSAGGGSPAATASASPAASAAASSPAASSQASASAAASSPAASASGVASPTQASSLHCPTLEEAVSATGFTDMTRSGTELTEDGAGVICTYAPPAAHGADTRQLEIDVLYGGESISQAEQADSKAGLAIESEPQFGTGGYMAGGAEQGYGLMCRVVGTSSTGAIVAITVTAPDDASFTPDDACSGAQEAAAIFLTAAS